MDHDQLNPFFQQLEVDYLYHLGLDTGMDLANIFAGVKYVILTRYHDDVAIIAHEFARKWYSMEEDSFSFQPIYKTERFHMYKIGPIIAISHGIGMPSLLICLNEIVKLLIHIKNFGVTFFKVGPAGGIGVEVGSIVISEEALNSQFEPVFHTIECGQEFSYQTSFDATISQGILHLAQAKQLPNLIVGKTIGAYDYYEEQGRLDGALPLPYTLEERDSYLTQASQKGVKSFDMEALAFAGFCSQLGIKACTIQSIIVNRLLSDQVAIGRQEQVRLLKDATNLLSEYIIHR
ncbi:MAG: hypothetical protein ACK4M7_03450 [Burkholderiales bacterium]